MGTATGVQGSFLGPLKLQQLKISLAAADVEIDDAELDADFTQLARRRLDVARRSAPRVTIALKPGTPQESPPSDAGAITRLPLSPAIHEARIGARSITPAGCKPIASDDKREDSPSRTRVVVQRKARRSPYT